MDVLILGAKSVVAVMLLIAGGAKLADVAGFAATIRLFLPWQPPRAVVRGLAVSVAAAEFLLGAASLSSPSARWLNPVIFAVTLLFVAIAAVGYAFYRGRSCRCFGALSQRKFDALGVLRGGAIAAVAAVAMSGVPSAAVQVGATERALLAVAAMLLALAALAAARSLGTSHRTESRSTA